jgi:hypothetical protein
MFRCIGPDGGGVVVTGGVVVIDGAVVTGGVVVTGVDGQATATRLMANNNPSGINNSFLFT